MYQLQAEAHFSAAHRLREYDGACENLHGHNWRVLVLLESEVVDRLGMVMDFKEVKALLGEILSRLDHVFLNDLDDFKEQNPTTENIARVIHDELSPRLPEGVGLGAVTVWESPGCSATYRA